MNDFGLPAAQSAVRPTLEMVAIPTVPAERAVVRAGSYLTLRYRLSLADGTEAVSTFGMGPATLALGTGQLAEPLEKCLIGMRAGTREAFTLEPEAAFGPRNPELIQRILRTALPREIEEDPGSRIAFTDASGAQFAGTLLEKDATHALFDFNHPLAGNTVVFEAEIIGVL